MTTSSNTKQFSHDELKSALYFIDDVMSRAAMPYFLVGSTAESALKKRDLTGDAIHVGVRSTDWHSSSLNIISIFKEADEIADDYFKYTHNEVPIIVHIFKKNHSCIQSTNPVMYLYEYFNVPNPYDQFLQLYTI